MLMHQHLTRGSLSVSQFFAWRVLRLLPAATCCVACTLVAGVVALPPLQRLALYADASAASVAWMNMHLASTAFNYVFQGVDPSPLLHYWSLSVEEQFYVVWPLLFLVLPHSPARRTRFVTLCALCAASLVLWCAAVKEVSFDFSATRALDLAGVAMCTFPFIMNSLVWTLTRPEYAFYSLPTRAWELLAGALVAETLDTHLARIPDATRAALASVGLAGLCVVCCACDDQTAALPGAITVLPVRFNRKEFRFANALSSRTSIALSRVCMIACALIHYLNNCLRLARAGFVHCSHSLDTAIVVVTGAHAPVASAAARARSRFVRALLGALAADCVCDAAQVQCQCARLTLCFVCSHIVLHLPPAAVSVSTHFGSSFSLVLFRLPTVTAVAATGRTRPRGALAPPRSSPRRPPPSRCTATSSIGCARTPPRSAGGGWSHSSSSAQRSARRPSAIACAGDCCTALAVLAATRMPQTRTALRDPARSWATCFNRHRWRSRLRRRQCATMHMRARRCRRRPWTR